MSKYSYSKNNKCKCGKLITDWAKQCNLCHLKILNKRKHPKNCQCMICKSKRGEYKGINSPFWHKKHSLKTRKLMSKQRKGKNKGINNSMYGKKRPEHSKNMKKLWDNDKFKRKRLIQIIKSLQLKPNQAENILYKLLKQLFKNKYKLNVRGKHIVAGKVPDFIDIKNKQIIELFGDYWHNRPEVKQRDIIRLKEYHKLGYSTLIVWEHELKNIDKLIIKILIFTK
jgi:very-short-patch-repair endonuclease